MEPRTEMLREELVRATQDLELVADALRSGADLLEEEGLTHEARELQSHRRRLNTCRLTLQGARDGELDDLRGAVASVRGWLGSIWPRLSAVAARGEEAGIDASDLRLQSQRVLRIRRGLVGAADATLGKTQPIDLPREPGALSPAGAPIVSLTDDTDPGG